MTKSPRRLKERVQESVGEQVRDLPLHAVRLAMFGVGRALLLSDRVTRDYKDMRENGVAPVLGRLRDDAQHTAVKVAGQVVTLVRGTEDEAPAPRPATPVATPPKPRPVNEDVTSDRPVAKPAPEPGTASAPKPSPAPSPKPAAQAKPLPEPEPQPEPEETKPAKPEPARPELKAADLPVPDYDTATLPQLRARLRGLTADQVRLLREYERKHAARADVLKMYENRISKLNGR